MLKVVFLLLVGAFATSYAEYRFQYNLYDLVKDKVTEIIEWFKKFKK